MADDLTTQSTTLATVPSGSRFATDEVGVNGGTAAHVQWIKLADGTANGTDGIPGTAARGLTVDPREKITEFVVTSSGLTTATTNYTAGDMLGSEITMSSVPRASGGAVTFLSAVMVDKAKVLSAVDVFLFNAASTPAADNAANSWADADMLNCVEVVEFGDIKQSANNYLLRGINLPLTVNCSGTSLFHNMVTRSAHAFFGAGGDIVIKYAVLQH